MIIHARSCRSRSGCTLFLLLLAACADAPEQTEVPRPTFEEIAEEVNRIDLEEPDTALITDVWQAGVTGARDLLLVDGMQNQLRRYDGRDGRLLRSVGRAGSGPREFRRPTSVAWTSDGRVYVSDLNNFRIARYTMDLALDTTFRFDEAGVKAVYPLPDGTLLVKTGRRDWPHAFERYTPEMVRMNGVHPHHPLLDEVPYWNSVWDEHVAIGTEHLFVASNMVYPLYRYTWSGEVVDSFGSPPPSWMQASRPQQGEFMGPGSMEAVQRWFRSFTRINHLGVYGDSLLLVSHETYDPEELSYFDSSFRMDVYDLQGNKRMEDVELPGRILHVADLVYVLVDQPPGGWAIGTFRLRPLPRRSR